ncbi:MaoC/PaaZ C-terminal domain-containing protein [Brevibacterium album]|uniref:MaoC/PaaZ C-terminal domain-containing protein n=1 Tax=Brevibacterium album TaxID=417948 RepID=UPI0004239E1E|nr:MaoC/PaaZ C-terminal domain-containing protein [Brevibacterium album]
MPLETVWVGAVGDAARDIVEDRWTMNYAASVYDENDRYYENRGAVPSVHPTYVSQLEWAAIGNLYERLGGLSETERRRGVHSWNHTVLHETFGRGCTLESTAVVVGVDTRRSGGRYTVKVETTCAGRPVATSFTSTIFRDVAVRGDDVVPELPAVPDAPDAAPARIESIPLSALALYHFSECARDYGAIHTDRAVAEAAGLPGLILHGTGTYAYVLSSITNNEAGGDPGRILGFTGRLGAMIVCPSTVELRTFIDGDTIHYTLINQDGDAAISQGVVRLGRC